MSLSETGTPCTRQGEQGAAAAAQKVRRRYHSRGRLRTRLTKSGDLSSPLKLGVERLCFLERVEEHNFGEHVEALVGLARRFDIDSHDARRRPAWPFLSNTERGQSVSYERRQGGMKQGSALLGDLCRVGAPDGSGQIGGYCRPLFVQELSDIVQGLCLLSSVVWCSTRMWISNSRRWGRNLGFGQSRPTHCFSARACFQCMFRSRTVVLWSFKIGCVR